MYGLIYVTEAKHDMDADKIGHLMKVLQFNRPVLVCANKAKDHWIPSFKQSNYGRMPRKVSTFKRQLPNPQVGPAWQCRRFTELSWEGQEKEGGLYNITLIWWICSRLNRCWEIQNLINAWLITCMVQDLIRLLLCSYSALRQWTVHGHYLAYSVWH